MAEKISFRAFTFEPKPNGVEVTRAINVMQDEFIGVWPWNLFEKIIAARAAENSKPKES